MIRGERISILSPFFGSRSSVVERQTLNLQAMGSNPIGSILRRTMKKYGHALSVALCLVTIKSISIVFKIVSEFYFDIIELLIYLSIAVWLINE